jgi:predicted molibdopterin-dependent oxidoreductase YjgC
MINGFWICDKGRYEYAYLDQNRQDKIVVNNSLDSGLWPEITFFLAGQLRRLFKMNRSARIGLIIQSWLSNEELFLIHKIFRNDIKVEKIHFLDPPEESADDFLLTAERSPNRRGAKEIGFDLQADDWGKFFEDMELLLVFASPFWNDSAGEQVKTALSGVDTKVLFTSHDQEINSSFDIVLPISLIAEREGSLTNIVGSVQDFSPALQAPGDSRPAWQFLVELARKLGLNNDFYGRFSSPSGIRDAMKKEIPFFREVQ